jgi:hypothetical protein
MLIAHSVLGWREGWSWDEGDSEKIKVMSRFRCARFDMDQQGLDMQAGERSQNKAYQAITP